MDQKDLQKLREDSEKGDLNAQYELGRMMISGAYFDDIFIDQNIPEGLILVKNAAIQGHTTAKEYLYDNELRLQQIIKRRKTCSIVPVCILLGFVALLVFLGYLAGIHYGWKDTFKTGLYVLISTTSCFWMMLVIVLVQSIHVGIRNVSQVSQHSNGTPLSSFLVFMFGFIFVVTILIVAFRFPEPTPFQYTVFRIILALAAAGIAAFVPGFLKLKIQNWLSAGGALAVFCVVFFFSPAEMVTNKQDKTVPVTPQEQIEQFAPVDPPKSAVH